MEQYIRFLPFLIILVVLGALAVRYFMYGSLTGVLVGARIARTIGTVESQRAFGMNFSVAVHVLERELGGPSMIAVGETSRGWGSRKMTAMKLTQEQARELARLLELAAKG